MAPIRIARKLKISADYESGEPRLSDRRQRPRRSAPRSAKFKLLLIVMLGVILAGITAGFYSLVLPAQRIYTSAQNISTSFNALSDDLDAQDLTAIDQYFFDIQVELANINNELDQYEFLDDLSFTKGYYQNLQVIRRLSDRTKIFMDKALPEFKLVLSSLGYDVQSAELLATADLTATQTTNNKKDQAKDEQLKQIIKELPRLIDFYEELEPDIIEILEIFNQLDPDYIPNLGDKTYGKDVRKIQKLTKDFPELSKELKQTISKLPNLLGAKRKVRYLVLLQNEKEMRASGGIFSAYGVVTVKNGEIVGDIDFTDTWPLAYRADALAAAGLFQPYYNQYGQLTLMLRGCGPASQRAQDSGDTPDLYDAMNKFAAYYDVANQYDYADEYPDYDHIVIFNTFFVSDMISFVDPIKVKNEDGNNIRITSNNIAKKVFGVTSSTGESNRKGYIGEVGAIVFKRFTQMNAGEFPGVITKFIETVQAKNIAFASKNQNMQNYFDSLGLSGRIERKFNGDYFNLSEAQNCALKANFYIRNNVTQDISIEKNGDISKKVNIHWENHEVYNPKKHTHILTANDRHLYRAWVRIMAPKNAEFTYSDGYEKSGFAGYQPQSYINEELNKKVSDNVIWYDYRRNTEQDPPTKYDLNVEYKLPDHLNYNDTGVYRMLVQKHPGKRNEKYTINIQHNGKVTTKQFKLNRDKVVIYRDGVIMIENYDQTLDTYTDLLN